MNKTERLGLVLTEQEKSWVINLAELEGGLTQAALIRRLIYNAAKEYGFTNDLPRQLAAKDAEIEELLLQANIRFDEKDARIAELEAEND